MNKYLCLTLLLCLFILAAGVSALEDNSSSSPSPSREDHINVYYFHTSYRCVTCTNMEKYTDEAINKNFGQELAKGKLKFASVNVDEKENKHFIGDYRLFSKHVILSRVEKGKEVQWKDLDQIWMLARSPDKFKSYIANETRAFLEELKRN